MAESFTVTWRISDGYVGRDRPHHFTIPADSLNGDETDDDLRRIFEEMLEEEFAEKIQPYSDDDAKFIAWARERIAEMRKEAGNG